MKVTVKVYDKCKYEVDSKVVARVSYDIEDFEVKKISKGEIEAEGYDEFDDYNEYLILSFGDGTTATFRNSHVDMFRD